MADRTSGDRPANFKSGALEGQKDSSIGASDHTPSDIDPTSSDGDQTSTASTHLAADRDQPARDRDLAFGVNPAALEFSRDIRQRAAHQREHTARARLDAAAERDQVAHTRDIAALARDQAAAARELAMTQRNLADEQDAGLRAVTGAEIVMRAAAARKRAARRRAQAAEHDALAAQDRHAAAEDREQAAVERRQALADREALARQVAIIETDALTGARPRAAGLIDLDHELERCRRTRNLLVIAYVDVVTPRNLHDSADQSAVDELLKRAVAHIHEHLRSYDLIIRLGGSEFLCAMSNMTLPDARQRFGVIASAIAAAAGAEVIATGFAALTSHESATELIVRASSDLIATRRTIPTTDLSSPAR